MADNTVLATASGGDTIATDDLATINGGAVGSAVKVQRVKIGFGSDSDFRDVDVTHGLPIVGVQDARTTGAITTSSTVIGPVAVSNRNVVTVDLSGTYAGITFVLEGSPDGGTTYYPVQGVNNATGQLGSTWTPAANASMTIDISVGGFTHFRVRSTAFTSGSGATGITPQVFAYEPVAATLPQGLVAAGVAVIGNPIMMGLSDGTNARFLLGDSSGRLAIGGAAASGATIAGNPVMNGGTFTTTLPTVTTGQAVNMQCTARGEQLVAISSGATAVAVKAASTAAAAADPALVVSMAGANSAVKVGDGTNNAAVKAASTAAATTDPALVVSIAGANSAVKIGDGTNNAAVKAASTAAAAADPAVTVALSPNMAPTLSAVNSAATTNATSVKASAGTVFSVVVSNTGGAAAFVKLYNKASAPTVGTDVPVITFTVPASGSVPIDFGTFGCRFGTGIALAITNLAADSDTTAVAANQVKVLTSYV